MPVEPAVWELTLPGFAHTAADTILAFIKPEAAPPGCTITMCLVYPQFPDSTFETDRTITELAAAG